MASRAMQIILSIAIAIVLALFIGFGINAFYKGPNYDDFCGAITRAYYNNSQECQAVGGMWTQQPNVCPADSPKCPQGYCDSSYQCSKNFDNANRTYYRIVFIIAMIAGLISIIVATILKMESVSLGLMIGGVISMIYGSIAYWRWAGDILRFVLLGVALAVLIWIGYKKINPALKEETKIKPISVKRRKK